MNTEAHIEDCEQWYVYYTLRPEQALADRQEARGPGGLVDPARQLGLSKALTPAEHRCAHFGDVRVCPMCMWEGEETQKAEREREQKIVRERRAKDKQIAELKAHVAAAAEIVRLRRVEARLQQQAAAAQRQKRGLGLKARLGLGRTGD